jgi:hypothetical protein
MERSGWRDRLRLGQAVVVWCPPFRVSGDFTRSNFTLKGGTPNGLTRKSRELHRFGVMLVPRPDTRRQRPPNCH